MDIKDKLDIDTDNDTDNDTVKTDDTEPEDNINYDELYDEIAKKPLILTLYLLKILKEH